MFSLQPRKFKHIYGPVSSWRLGRSLGVDLLSQAKKVCTFDCVYCQLGPNPKTVIKRGIFVPTEKILAEIKRLPDSVKIDHITFSGKGEPTLAANLASVIKGIRRIRKEKIAVITNSSLMNDRSVIRALSLADMVVAKVDASSHRCFAKVNKPVKRLKFEAVYGAIKKFRKHYKGRLAVQIMFFSANKADYREIADAAFGIVPDEIEINTPTRRSPVKPLTRNEVSRITAYFKEAGRKANSKAKVISLYEAKRKKTEAIDKEATIRRRGEKRR
ncbi:MAG: radical SAM protein [Candidatus Omnitrophota bacterium]|nr:radical SAM protein [Candidatus Omnitrophota bacterium]